MMTGEVQILRWQNRPTSSEHETHKILCSTAGQGLGRLSPAGIMLMASLDFAQHLFLLCACGAASCTSLEGHHPCGRILQIFPIQR